MKVPFWLAPVLWAVCPPLFFYAISARLWERRPLLFFVPSLALAALVLAFSISCLLRRSGPAREKALTDAKAGVLASFSIIGFFSYFVVRFVLELPGGGAPFRFEGLVGLLVWGAVFLLGAREILRSRQDLSGALACLAVMGGCVVLLNVVQLGRSGLGVWGVAASLPSHRPLAGASAAHGSLPNPPPDIYYIIVDRYPDAATLRQHFALDNAPFLDSLTRKGFYVAEESRSNYLKTGFSLASSLNMDYINYLEQELGPQRAGWTYLYPLLEDYRVWRLLRARGYRFIHVGSDWDPTRHNRYADENVNYFAPPEGYWEVVDLTPLEALGSEAGIGYFDRERMHYERTRREFQRLAELAHEPGPKFVFAHLIVPHSPYIFDRDGSYLPPWVAVRRTREENFRNQVLAVNRQLEATVDRILAESSVPPVILIQGDEGPFPIRYRMNQYEFDWRTCSTDELREKTGILNAYYLPGVSKESLTPTLSPVNSFRLVFNLYFGAQLPLLKDETYAHGNDQRPYDFFPVTARLRPPASSPRGEPGRVARPQSSSDRRVLSAPQRRTMGTHSPAASVSRSGGTTR